MLGWRYTGSVKKLEPILWAAGAGAMTSLADWAHTAIVGETFDYKRMLGVALCGAACGLAAYFRNPNKKDEEKK